MVAVIVVLIGLIYGINARVRSRLQSDAYSILDAATQMAERAGHSRMARMFREDVNGRWSREALRLLTAEDSCMMLGDLNALPHEQKVLVGAQYLLRIALEVENLHIQATQRLGYDPFAKE